MWVVSSLLFSYRYSLFVYSRALLSLLISASGGTGDISPHPPFPVNWNVLILTVHFIWVKLSIDFFFQLKFSRAVYASVMQWTCPRVRRRLYTESRLYSNTQIHYTSNVLPSPNSMSTVHRAVASVGPGGGPAPPDKVLAPPGWPGAVYRKFTK